MCLFMTMYMNTHTHTKLELFHATNILVIVNYESIIGKDNLAKYQQ